MSEILTPNTHEFNVLQDANTLQIEGIRNGIELANSKTGFDVISGLRLDHPELSDAELLERKTLVENTAAGMAHEAGLKADFFEDTSSVVLLTAIADSWVSNEQRAVDNPYDERIGREREMLADVLLMAAGGSSEYLQELSANNPELASRYLPTETSTQGKESEAFYDSISDAELADKVKTIFSDNGEGAFLDAQRAALGINSGNEKPFEVRVLNMGNQYEFKRAGVLGNIKWPEFTKDPTAVEKYMDGIQTKAATLEHGRQQKFMQPFKDNEKRYEQELKEKQGNLPAAFVSFNSGRPPVLTLRAPEAHLLINYMSGKKVAMDDEADLERSLAVLRHEYAHTQKYLHRGEHVQLGLNLEERKAELVSGDKQGYLDVKYMMTDLSGATGVNIVEELGTALLEEDALGAFLSSSATKIGLRNTLLLMATKPLPYDSNPEHAKEFAQLGCLVEPGDGSALDIAIRHTLETRGDDELVAKLDKWVDSNPDVDTDFFVDSYIPYRAKHGLKRANPYMRRAAETLANKKVSEQTEIEK